MKCTYHYFAFRFTAYEVMPKALHVVMIVKLGLHELKYFHWHGKGPVRCTCAIIGTCCTKFYLYSCQKL